MSHANNHITITVSGLEDHGQAAIVKLIYEVLKDEFRHIRVLTDDLDMSMEQMLVNIDQIKDRTMLSIIEENIEPAPAPRPPHHHPAPPPGYHEHGRDRGFGE